MSFTFITLPSPVGELKLVANGARLAAILWENDRPNRVRLGPMTQAPDIGPAENDRQMEEYFAGTRNCLSSSWILPVGFSGNSLGSVVTILGIPPYSQLLTVGTPPRCGRAQRMGHHSIVAPCHGDWRAGKLTGFPGG